MVTYADAYQIAGQVVTQKLTEILQQNRAARDPRGRILRVYETKDLITKSPSGEE